jgi:hypothetical protein
MAVQPRPLVHSVYITHNIRNVYTRSGYWRYHYSFHSGMFYWLPIMPTICLASIVFFCLLIRGRSGILNAITVKRQSVQPSSQMVLVAMRNRTNSWQGTIIDVLPFVRSDCRCTFVEFRFRIPACSHPFVHSALWPTELG